MRDRSAGRNLFSAVGRRKTAIAKVLLQPGTGNVIIDGDRFVGKKGSGRFLSRGPSHAPAGL